MPHSYTRQVSHIVFGTKDRKSLIDAPLRERLSPYISGIISNLHSKVLAIGGAEDHIHILADIHPQIALSDFVRTLKSNSSKWIHEQIGGQIHFQWQTGYSAFSVSQSNVNKVIEYIHGQEEHHKKTTFAEELEAFFKKHNMPWPLDNFRE